MKIETKFKHASSNGMLVFEVKSNDVAWEIAIKPTKLVENDLGVVSEFLTEEEIHERVRAAVINDAYTRPDVIHNHFKNLKPLTVEV